MEYSTFPITDDRLTDVYVYFGGSSFAKSCAKKVFQAKASRLGGSLTKPVVVKVLGEGGPASHEDCQLEVEKARTANTLAIQYEIDSLVSSNEHQIRVKVPHIAQIEDVTWWNRFKGRPLDEEEWVLVEPKLQGRFKQFVGRNGERLSREGRALAAFAHYTFHVSEGQLLVCNLQGVRGSSGFRLVSPTLHSLDRSHGPCDEGLWGMQTFFRNHDCSPTCRGWRTPPLPPPEVVPLPSRDVRGGHFLHPSAPPHCEMEVHSSDVDATSSRNRLSSHGHRSPGLVVAPVEQADSPPPPYHEVVSFPPSSSLGLS